MKNMCDKLVYAEEVLDLFYAASIGQDRAFIETVEDVIIDTPCVDAVEVVRCKDCKHSKSLDRTKPPFKYYKDSCILCECEDVVGDEPMVYLPDHFCSYGVAKW